MLDTSIYSHLFIQQPEIIPLGGYMGWSISIMDYNQDGYPDFFGNCSTDSTTTGYSKSAMAEKKGSLDDYEISFFFPDTFVEYITSADINSDGKIDFLVSAIDSGQYYSLRCYTLNPLTGYPDSILFKQFILPGVVVKPTIGYFDGDNQIDFITLNNHNVSGGCNSCVAFYEYDTNIQKFSLHQTIDIENEFREFVVADFDSDSLQEFFTGSTLGLVLGIKNVSDNKYMLFLTDTIFTPNLYVSRKANDLDNDGYLDIFLVGTTWNYSELYWLLYSQDMLRVVRKLVLFGTDIFSNIHLELYDIDNDDTEELIFNLGFGVLILKWSNVTNKFEVFYYHEVLHSESIDCITFFDFDDDSTPDMFISVSRVEQPSFITYYFKNNLSPSSVSELNTISNFNLFQNYPNPFNPTTTIKFALPLDSKVKINVYNSLGQLVETLVNKEMESGYHEVNFDASRYSSGVYLYQLQVQDYVSVKKMILLK